MNSPNDCFTLKNGVQIPCLGFGTWQSPNGEVTERSVREAILAGYSHIDTAAAYGNEESVGRGIRESGIARKGVFVTTKVWNTERGYEATLKAFDDSMKLLSLEYCDLYLIHWPNPAPFRSCWQQKNSETWRAMEKLYSEGRIRAIGISNFLQHHINALLQTATIMPTVNQIRINPTEGQSALVDYCRRLGILIEAYSPLGTGSVLEQPGILACAEKYSKSPAQICLRWSLQKGFLPLPKSVTPARIRQNVNVFDFELSEKDMAVLDTLEGRMGYSMNPDEVDF